jgi:hypothetical protein
MISFRYSYCICLVSQTVFNVRHLPSTASAYRMMLLML